MYTTVLVLLLVACVQTIMDSDVLEAEWKAFKLKHGKSYGYGKEETMRFKIFKDNKYMIATHNKRWAAGKKTYKMGVNKFTDLQFKELEGCINNATMDVDKNSTMFYIAPTVSKLKLPKRINWRKKGAVSSVKDQGNCCSCWAFSAIGTLEGQYFRKKQKLFEMSAQNLLDCANSTYSNYGCERGMPNRALHYVRKKKGVDTERSYPYKASVGNCEFHKKHPSYIGMTINRIIVHKGKNETTLKHYVAKKGPISVIIHVHPNFVYYERGVFNEEDCGEVGTHAVLVVGYDTQRREGDYWVVKNSWGDKWGEKGYVRMARNKGNQCGIANTITFPMLETN